MLVFPTQLSTFQLIADGLAILEPWLAAGIFLVPLFIFLQVPVSRRARSAAVAFVWCLIGFCAYEVVRSFVVLRVATLENQALRGTHHKRGP